MILRISTEITSYLESKGVLVYEFEIYQYGIAMIISYSIGMLIILTIGLTTNKLYFSIIYLFMFDYLRRYGGGYHAKSYFSCNAYFVALYLLTLVLNELITPLISLLIIAIPVLIVFSFLPIEHPNKRLFNDEILEKRSVAKRRYIYVLIFSILIWFKLEEITKYMNIVIFIVAMLGILQICINERR